MRRAMERESSLEQKLEQLSWFRYTTDYVRCNFIYFICRVFNFIISFLGCLCNVNIFFQPFMIYWLICSWQHIRQ
jgi:hypothetical protein